MKGKNMKYRLLFLAMAVCATLATSCSDDELPGDNNGTNDANAIQFGVTSTVVEARTVYGDPGTSVNWPLYWKANDQIHIYCPDAEDITDAGYVVAPKNGSTTTHEGTISPLTENVYLKWSGDSNPHDFYAAYPYGKATAVELAEDKSTAYITFAVNNNQTCTINTTPTDGNYVAEPDMTNAYMVAHNLDVKPSVDAVSLDFKPIMTTLVVKVTAPEWALNTTGHATITGISVITEVDSEDANKGQFVYDVVNKSIVSNPTGNKTSHSTFVGVKHGENNFIDLGSNQTLTMTVFLPPIPINNNNPVQVKLHVAGSDFVAHLGEATPETKPTNHIYANVTIEPSQIRRVNLLTLPDPLPTTSAWLTPLDNDIYVSQLSIPGTHDAATLECGLSSGQCQDLTITQQLEMGIRFFDLRPTGPAAVIETSNTLPIYHGTIPCYITLQEVWAEFNSFLDKNPGEFIIALLRWESEKVMINGETRFNNAMNTFVTSDTYTKKALPLDKVKKDVTIGEMRGKILSIMRPNQGSDPDGYFTTTAPIGMTYISGFPGSHATGTQQAYCKPQYVNYGSDQWGSHTDWIVYCQNYYEVPNNATEREAKIEAIKTYLKHSQIQASQGTNVWVINHCSGYLGTVAIGDVYKDLAKYVNPEIYKYILQQSTDASGAYKPIGSTGIMLLDFVGSRVSASANVIVYGDLLPQTIIDNNYKYRMKRKGE